MSSEIPTTTHWKSVGQSCPSNDFAQHVQIQFDLPVPTGINAIHLSKIYNDLRQSFLTSYRNEAVFKMSVQGLQVGAPTWHLRGRVMLKTEVRHRSARRRVRDLLITWHDSFVSGEDERKAFGKLLESKLAVKPAVDPFSAPISEPTHSWTPVNPYGQSSWTAAAAYSASGPRTVDVVPGPAARSAGAPGPPAWVFNRHSGSPHTCTGSCCPPGASSLASGASLNYAGPPFMYPGVESSPYGLLTGRGLGSGNGDHLMHWSDWRGSANGGAAGRISADQGCGSGLGAPVLPATPRSCSLGTGRPRSTPPAATASESPASKRARPGEEPMARNRLDFGPPPPSAGGAGAVTPAAATAKGPDIGPTPAHPAPLAGSPETSSLAPLSRVLDYEPAGADAGAGLAPDSEGANLPITPPRPPRPPDRGRERESDGTPSSVLAPPRKRREGPGPLPAAMQGLSFPGTAASARSEASESPALFEKSAGALGAAGPRWDPFVNARVC